MCYDVCTWNVSLVGQLVFLFFFIGTSTPSMITRGSARIQSFEVTGHVLINQFSAGPDVKFLPRTVHEINPCNKDI